MKSIKFIWYPVFLLMMNCSLHAQSKDTTTAQKMINKGSEGDIILGEKNKKDQLNNAPVLLYSKDSICRKGIIRSSKKLRRNQNKKSS